MAVPGIAARPLRARLVAASHVLLAAYLAMVALACTFPFEAIGEESTPAREAVGQRYFERGEFQAAADAWTVRYLEAERAGETAAAVYALGRRAEAYRMLGYLGRAIDDLHRAISLASEAAGAAMIARLRGSLGNALYANGQWSQAAEEIGSCLTYALGYDDKPLAALAFNDAGIVLAYGPRDSGSKPWRPESTSQRDDDASYIAILTHVVDANSAYEQSYSLALETGNFALAGSARLNAARYALGRGDLSSAAQLSRESIAQFRRAAPSSRQAMGLISGATLLMETSEPAATLDAGPYRLAYSALNEAMKLSRKLGDRASESEALGQLGHLYERSDRLDEALQLTERALFRSSEVSAPEISYRWQRQIGRIQRARGNATAAITAYRDSIETLRSIRADLTRAFSGSGGSFQHEIQPIFLELTDLLLVQEKSISDEEQAQAALREARATMETLKTVELESYFQDDCVATLQAKITPIDTVAEQTAALYPIVFDDRVELLVTLPSGLTRRSVPVASAALEREVRSFRRLLGKRTTREYLRPARQLYEWLIAPIEPDLERADVDTLIFVPYGPLRTIPISALYDGNEHLVSRFATAVTPGLTLLDPRPIRERRIEGLVSGLTQSVQGFPPLPYVEEELKSINQLFGGEVLQDEAFRTAAVTRELERRPFTIVHMASHAYFDADASQSFLLTYDGKLTMDSLEQFIKLSQFRDEPVELLTLSACATAAGDDRAALGLAGIAVKAGARSALATLWFVNDEATSILVTEFYRQLLHSEVSKAQALRLAQLELLDADDYRFRHPIYWAPFLLIGNWL